MTAGRPPSRATSSWCAPGSAAGFCLEDAVCAGLLVSRLAAGEGALTDAARAARALWDRYAGDLPAMLADAAWAQALVAQGRGTDLPLCVALDVHDVVPVSRRRPGGKVVS